MLTAAQFQQARAALDKAKGAAVDAAALAGDVSFWTPSSTAEAMRSNAAATSSLADALEGRLERWMVRLEPVTDDELADFLRGAGIAADNSTLQATHDLVQTSNAAATIAGDTAKDAAKVAGKLAIGGGVLAVAAAVVLAVIYLPRPRR